MKTVSRGIDRVVVASDEPNLVAYAGLLLVATIVKRLRLESLIDEVVKIPAKRGGYLPGRKVLTLVSAMVAGATHIDHVDVLHAGSSAEVLEHRVMAPSTMGTFLRSFTFGHVRQLESVVAEALRRAWSAMTVPTHIVVDVDSTICEVSGSLKQGAAYGYGCGSSGGTAGAGVSPGFTSAKHERRTGNHGQKRHKEASARYPTRSAWEFRLDKNRTPE